MPLYDSITIMSTIFFFFFFILLTPLLSGELINQTVTNLISSPKQVSNLSVHVELNGGYHAKFEASH